ncbi:hypothetical protein Moror_15278 [Moniliophthora roreri MCA 2997]|uniref:Hyaluronan/mRNA-binding protein domain-containing protein n=1 Tax=Moniliophthora roreri (strain MCA 2997) TaxID=1381753 RepID=V2X513_MONRO|nr:hypothetical protein Moror_15278 [Moniliophthora roreri MCA 2997]
MSSVASKNPFALLDEGDDGEISSPPAPAPKKTTAPSAPTPSTNKDNQKARTGPASRGGKYYQRGGARSRDQSGNPNQNGVEDPDAAPRKFEGRGRGRGGGGRGAPRGGRRPFDRHSATGKTDSDKKIHQGWGGDDGNTELQAEAAASKDAAAEGAATGGEWGADGATNADAWAAPADAPADGDKPAGEEGSGSRPPRKEEEEDNTLTLDQYLAQQKEKDAVVPKPELRKVEGADFGDAVALQKGGEDEAYFVGKTKTVPKARAKKEEKVYLEIDARFDRPGRGGRGGRGDRGRGGRGGGRGGNRNSRGDSAPTFNVDDEAAFPSLS